MSFSPNSRVNKNNLSRSCNIWPIWLAINQTIYLRIHECVLRRGILMVTRSLLCLYLWMVNWSTRRLDLNISKWQWWAVYQTEPEEPYSQVHSVKNQSFNSSPSVLLLFCKEIIEACHAIATFYNRILLIIRPTLQDRRGQYIELMCHLSDLSNFLKSCFKTGSNY